MARITGAGTADALRSIAQSAGSLYGVSEPVFPYQALPIQRKAYEDRDNKWEATHEFTADSDVKTPLGVIEDKYGKTEELVEGWEKIVTTQELKGIHTASRPRHSVATKKGASSSGDRTGGLIETQVKRLGQIEKKLKGRGSTMDYAGGHLVAWNVLKDDSNAFENIAPQAVKFNHPFYYNAFEQIGQNAENEVKITVDVEYRSDTYSVDEDTLISKKIIKNKERTREVEFPTRIPYRWTATVETTDASKALGTEGSYDKTNKDIYIDEKEYKAGGITRSKGRGFKALVESAGSGAGKTGGAAKKVTVSAEQDDGGTPQAEAPEAPVQVPSAMDLSDSPLTSPQPVPSSSSALFSASSSSVLSQPSAFLFSFPAAPLTSSKEDDKKKQ